MQIDVKGFHVTVDGSCIRESDREIRQQVKEYLTGDRKQFNLEIFFPDTFTGRVMQAMQDISYGETRTYGELAERLDSAAIAVGQACGNNPAPIVVPCHRVVAANGSGGYQYPGLKEKLLQLENAL